MTTSEIIDALRAQCDGKTTHDDTCGCQLAARMEAMWELIHLWQGIGPRNDESAESCITIQMSRMAERRRTEENDGTE